ncbi:MAG: CsgG/HfaB family protein [Gemmatimonadales bacterium]
MRISSAVVGVGLFSLAACAPGRVASVPGPVAAADSAVRAAIAAERTFNPASIPAQTIGVAPFRVAAADTSLNALGYGLADFLATDLARSSRLRVVDRLRVAAFLRETGLASRGFVDSATAPRMGRLVGARRIVSGALLATNQTRLQLAGRVGDVVTGTVSPVQGTAAALRDVLDAEKALAFNIFSRLGISLSPAERAAIEERPTGDLGALIAYSRGLRAEATGDFGQARAEYRTARRLDPNFAAPAARLDALGSAAAAGPESPSVLRAGLLAAEGINRRTLPTRVDAADPAFRLRLDAVIIIVLQLP